MTRHDTTRHDTTQLQPLQRHTPCEVHVSKLLNTPFFLPCFPPSFFFLPSLFFLACFLLSPSLFSLFFLLPLLPSSFLPVFFTSFLSCFLIFPSSLFTVLFPSFPLSLLLSFPLHHRHFCSSVSKLKIFRRAYLNNQSDTKHL